MKEKYEDRCAYFVGGGIASLAGAVYLIRDCGFKGDNIYILEGLSILGGSNDGIGNTIDGFICRGGRMLNRETYENTWELFSSIPSIEQEGMSLYDEIISFDSEHPIHSNARLVNKDGGILDVTSMEFNTKDRLALAKLILTPEKSLDNLRISDWFKDTPHFFETNFWNMWQTTFGFKKLSGIFEFKRYMNRMILEYSRIETLEGVTRTRYNQYDSIIRPIKSYLNKFGVNFNLNCKVRDLEFDNREEIIVTKIYYDEEGVSKTIDVKEEDLCFVTNGCMTDNSSLGSFREVPNKVNERPQSAILWENIALKKEGLGNPKPFFGNVKETNWESFTVTCRGNTLLKKIEKFSNNIPGSGALMTFKDSSWLLSIVVAVQPHFKNQPDDITIFWGYGVYTDKTGDYVKKPMSECTGEEILTELLHHLHFEAELNYIIDTVINVIPCMMPYIISQFQPHAIGDRPQVVPNGSKNLAFIGQFVEMPEDMVFTEEYSIRSARTAVYKLLGIDKEICPVTPHKYELKTLLKAIHTTYR